MTIVLFGATGNIGQRIAREALRRHQVIGVVRDPTAVQTPEPRMTLVRGDATDSKSVATVARAADVVVSAISPRRNARGLPASSLRSATRALIAGSKKAGVKRLLIVGGAGTLEVRPGIRSMDTAGFPNAFKAEAQEGAESLDELTELTGPQLRVSSRGRVVARMTWSWKLARIAGIDIHLHITFLMAIVWIGAIYWNQNQSIAAVIQGTGFILALFVSIVLHEYGHALTSRRYGIWIRDITLLPIGGLAQLERMPDVPTQEVWVALAGPAVNLIVAELLFIGLQSSGPQPSIG